MVPAEPALFQMACDPPWDWDEHMTRLWPPVPSWEEVQRAPPEIRGED